MKKVVVLLLMLVALVGSTFSASAQDALKPGDTVEGEITNDNFAVTYDYVGIGGEVIIVDLFPVDILADYDNPAIIIQLDGEEVLRYDGYGETTVVTQLPEDGTYSIIASRRDDADGDSAGEYTLPIEIVVANGWVHHHIVVVISCPPGPFKTLGRPHEWEGQGH